jgi:hypothetical protein
LPIQTHKKNCKQNSSNIFGAFISKSSFSQKNGAAVKVGCGI